MSMELTYSRMQSWLDCRRLYKFQYVDLLEPYEDSSALRIGSATHSWLRDYHLFGLGEPAIDRFYDGVESYTDIDSFNDAIEWEKALAKAMLAGYAKKYGEHEFMIVDTEQTIKTGIDKACQFAGRVDMIVDDDISDGVWVVEHKTTSSIDSRFFERLAIDTQVTGYLYLASQVYDNVLGVIYNVIRKPSIRQTKSETKEEYFQRMETDYLERPDFYFARQETVRNEVELKAFPAHVKDIAREIAFSSTYPRNTSRCNLYGKCAFRSLCVEWSDELASTYKQKEKANQELDNAF